MLTIIQHMQLRQLFRILLPLAVFFCMLAVAAVFCFGLIWFPSTSQAGSQVATVALIKYAAIGVVLLAFPFWLGVGLEGLWMVLPLIVLVVGTYVMFLMLEIVASPIPAVQTGLSCAEGTSINYEWVQKTWDSPGQTTMERHCLDRNGNQSAVFPDEVYNQRQRELFMPIAFVSMLVIESAFALIYYNRKIIFVKK